MFTLIFSLLLSLQQLNDLVETKNMFKLRDAIENQKDFLNDKDLLYYQANINSAFNNIDLAQKQIIRLFDKHLEELTKDQQATLLSLKVCNFVKKYDYNGAAETCRLLIEEYPEELEDIDEIKSLEFIFSSISDVPAQNIFNKKKTNKISYTKNQFNHILLDVNIGDKEEAFIFDTGADFSVITYSNAKKMGVNILDGSFDLGGSTNAKVGSGIGYADSLYINDILFTNVIFMILPDEELNFSEAGLKIEGILGFPVMYQMNEITFDNEGFITLSKEITVSTRNNLGYSDLKPVINAKTEKGEYITFTFDTGANTSELSCSYYTRHKEHIDENYAKVTKSRGGVGAVVDVDNYNIPDFSLYIGSQCHVFDSIAVEVKEYSFNSDHDGNLGQDILSSYSKWVINFQKMYFDLIK